MLQSLWWKKLHLVAVHPWVTEWTRAIPMRKRHLRLVTIRPSYVSCLVVARFLVRLVGSSASTWCCDCVQPTPGNEEEKDDESNSSVEAQMAALRIVSGGGIEEAEIREAFEQKEMEKERALVEQKHKMKVNDDIFAQVMADRWGYG